jgi:hypothetical protein
VHLILETVLGFEFRFGALLLRLIRILNKVLGLLFFCLFVAVLGSLAHFHHGGKEVSEIIWQEPRREPCSWGKRILQIYDVRARRRKYQNSMDESLFESNNTPCDVWSNLTKYDECIKSKVWIELTFLKKLQRYVASSHYSYSLTLTFCNGFQIIN